MNQIPNINHIANGEDRLLVHNGEVIPNIECKYCHGHDCPECDALPNIEEEKRVDRISRLEIASWPGGVEWFEASFPYYKLNLYTLYYEFAK